MADLTKLKLDRGQFKAKLTRFETFLDRFSTDKIAQLESRLDDIIPILSEFNTVQSQIEELDAIELGKDDRQLFEDRYYESVGKAKQAIRDFYAPASQSGASAATSNSSNTSIEFKSNVKLPTMQLPTFDGDYEHWEHFRDMFLALVHQDASIDNIRKFYYLSSALTGAAAKVIKSINVTNDNYLVAWDLLKNRFEDKDTITRKHVKAIVEMKPVSGDSRDSLREFTDDLQVHIRSLESLGEEVDKWSSLLNYIIWKKLDSETQDDWEEHVVTKKLKRPEYKVLIEFLIEKCKFLEKRDNSKKIDCNKQVKNFDNRDRNKSYHQQHHHVKKYSVSNFATKRENLCQFCKGEHYIYFCEKLKNLPVASRLVEIKKLSVCINCLRGNHRSKDCNARGCKRCSKKHNTMLHLENQDVVSESNQASSSRCSNENNESKTLGNETSGNNLTLVCHERKRQILLSTAIVLVQDAFGNWHTCRALLDSGSQPNFMSKILYDKLNLKANKTNIPVIGVGESATNVMYRTSTGIKSLREKFEIKLTFLILEKITENLPVTQFDKSLVNIPPDVTLADESFNITDKIDLLLGAEIFYDLIKSAQIKLGPNLPVLQSTVLGWIVSGPIPSSNGKRIQESKKSVCGLALNELNFELERFWELEETLPKVNRSLEEQKCEEIFSLTTKRDETGRFVVHLPFKEDYREFGESLETAVNRLHAMERKFARNSDFKKRYVGFMEEYINLGHMSPVEPRDNDEYGKQVFYLPHHGVLNETSSTTRLRVVFDGSSKSSNGLSLNDLLLVGPPLQEDLFCVLLRYRKHTFVFKADIRKMYRMVNITKRQRNYQRILWRPSPDVDISHFVLNTVTYGLSSASFLAIRCLQQIGLDVKDIFPDVSNIILSDFYVDDVLSGAETKSKAVALISQLIQVLNGYGFELGKWAANDVNILKESGLEEMKNYEISDNEARKTLGMWWNAQLDVFSYKINIELYSNSEVLTKRLILSSTAKLFDPLGLLSPIIIQAKVMLQKLWQLKIGWDDPLPPEITQLWMNFVCHLPEVEKINIPRHVIFSKAKRIELHGFSDASEKAYGACFYLKSMAPQNDVKVTLLCSKSRVAPLKSVSLPRLELCGAVLLVRLYRKLSEAMKLQINATYFWTDSSIVLAWLKAPPNSWKVFVANRVSEIQSHTEISQWNHVRSGDNPADLVSRGVGPDKLMNSEIWWEGPAWLKLEWEFWPKSDVNYQSAPEKRKAKLVTFTAVFNDFSLFDRYSTLCKLKRIVAVIFRFFTNCRTKSKDRKFGPLSINELDRAFKALLRLAQIEAFSDEINALSIRSEVPKRSKLLSLNPFMDSENLIRVGGRITNSDLPIGSKHQIVLPSKHRLTQLIILNEHYRQFHAGSQAILNSLRQTCWIVDGRATIRSVLRKCLVCFRAKPMNLNRKMGDLPRDRVVPNRPFYVSGVDFAGPFLIKDGKLRNRAIVKAYLCLFICFSTKAVHLEIVGDLSSTSFLSALKRFISRRGVCKTIFSDNGTNFVGANTILQNTQSKNFLIENKIEWKFIPAHSPHQGGLWEAAIKIAKYHAKRVITGSHLTFEDLSTVFCQIEAIINSRPLTPLSSDPSDFCALTPGHFLIGSPLISLPQADVMEIPTNRLKQYERLQQMVQHFWSRWSREYLLSLQQRFKWQTSHGIPLNLGDLVVLIDEATPPQTWKLGRVTELHPGKDDITRVVTVKTPTGFTKRAVQKLCKLPIDN